MSKMSTLQQALCAPTRTNTSARTRSDAKQTTSPTTSNNASPAPIGASRLADFCARYRMSRWTFADMKRRGEAPRTFKVGVLVYISLDAERDWIKEREAAEAAKQARTVHRIAR